MQQQLDDPSLTYGGYGGITASRAVPPPSQPPAVAQLYPPDMTGGLNIVPRGQVNDPSPEVSSHSSKKKKKDKKKKKSRRRSSSSSSSSSDDSSGSRKKKKSVNYSCVYEFEIHSFFL
jgi:hypothetical protein